MLPFLLLAGVNSFQCQICNKSFIYVESLKRHMEADHIGKLPIYVPLYVLGHSMLQFSTRFKLIKQ